jgi:hypothetical protein
VVVAHGPLHGVIHLARVRVGLGLGLP